MGFIQNLFARYRAREMFGPDASTQLGGEDRQLTAFFASIHSYVTLAEQLPLAQLRELMNRYFAACTDPIQARGGTLDKFVGDGVVAMFGAPASLPDHALRACLAALECQNEIAGLRQSLRAQGNQWPEVARRLRVRIGLNTGWIMVGNLGTAARFNYTMMGDEVNLAARLEKFAKTLGVWTLCSGSTKDACEQAEPGRIVFRSLGKIIVKGRSSPVELFEAAATREAADDRLRECIRIFESGIARMEAKDFDHAISCFEQSAQLERDQPDLSLGIEQNPSSAHARVAAHLRANPPNSARQSVQP